MNFCVTGCLLRFRVKFHTAVPSVESPGGVEDDFGGFKK